MIPVRHSSRYEIKTLYCVYINRLYGSVSFILEKMVKIKIECKTNSPTAFT